jgi:hypothetical protein
MTRNAKSLEAHYLEYEMYISTRIRGKADLQIRTSLRHRALSQPVLAAVELVHSVDLTTSFLLQNSANGQAEVSLLITPTSLAQSLKQKRLQLVPS